MRAKSSKLCFEFPYRKVTFFGCCLLVRTKIRVQPGCGSKWAARGLVFDGSRVESSGIQCQDKTMESRRLACPNRYVP